MTSSPCGSWRLELAMSNDGAMDSTSNFMPTNGKVEMILIATKT